MTDKPNWINKTNTMDERINRLAGRYKRANPNMGDKEAKIRAIRWIQARADISGRSKGANAKEEQQK